MIFGNSKLPHISAFFFLVQTQRTFIRHQALLVTGWQNWQNFFFLKVRKPAGQGKRYFVAKFSFVVIHILIELAIMQNMIFDSVFEVDSVLENKSDFLIVADSILNKRIWNNQIEQWRRNAVGCLHLPTASISTFLEGYLFLYQNEIFNNRCKWQVY